MDAPEYSEDRFGIRDNANFNFVNQINSVIFLPV